MKFPEQSDFEPAPPDELAKILAEYDELLAAGILLSSDSGSALSDIVKSSVPDEAVQHDMDILARLEAIGGQEIGGGQSAESKGQTAADPTLPAEAGQSPADYRLGRFQILRLLGRGGTGIVFLARDPLLSRDVALKVPRPETLLVPQMKERFLFEGQAAAGLNHPNIVPVFEAGQCGSICYLASAYCAGPTLASWLKDQSEPISLGLAVRWITSLADAVEYAHSRGVLHRDIKPGNVLLEPAVGQRSGEQYEPRLTDFGLAKLVDVGDSMTRPGVPLGTPRYMAPEQARGENKRIGPASDVYSLGVVLYELLAGHSPFNGKTEWEVLRQVTDNPPPPLGRWRSDVPNDLCAIVARCLEKEPEQRYTSAGELAADLQRWQRGEPTKARPLGTATRLARWGRRHPSTAALSAAVLLMAIGAFGAVTSQWRRAESHLAVAELERQRAEDHLRHENRVVSEMVLYFDRSEQSPHRPMLLKESAREQILNRYEAIFSQPESWQLSRHELATAHAKYALIAGTHRPKDEILRSMKTSLELWQQVLAEKPTEPNYLAARADAHIDAILVYLRFHELNLAEKQFAAAAEILTARLTGPEYSLDRKRLGTAYTELGQTLLTEGRQRRALTVFQRLLEYWIACGTTQTSERLYKNQIAATHRGMGKAYNALNRWNDAVACYEKSATLERELTDERPQNSSSVLHEANSYSEIAGCYERLDDRAAALNAYRRAEELYSRLLDRPGPDHGMSLVHLALIYGRMGHAVRNPPTAAAYFKKSIGVYDELIGVEPDVRQYRVERAECLYALARLQNSAYMRDAILTYFRAITAFEELIADGKSNDDEHGFLARSHMHAARLLVVKQQPEEALAHFTTATDLYRELLANRPHEKGFANDLSDCQQSLAQLGVVPAEK